MRRILYFFLLFAATNLLGVVARAQERTVSGTILADDDNSPLQGVTVTNKNTSKRVQTNAAGYYSIVADKGHVIIFTFVGYVRKEIVIGDEKMISPKLTPSDQQIGEVVVTAYGIKREKKSLGSDVQEIKGEDIAQTRRDNFINSLAGRVPGASVVSTSGAPGSSTSIILRGGTSLGLTNQPLFVIDGVPLDNNVVNQDRDGLQTRSTANRSDDFTNRAADINPEDIESLTILKGPEAQALYGSDGANGAIIITTKKGKTGKASVTYDNSLRLENLYRYHETQRVYARGRNGIANLNETNSAFGEAAALSPFFFGPKFAPGTTFYDNLNDFFRTGTTQQHNLSVEGGSDGFTYRFNTGYSNQKGVIPSSGFNRLSVRFSGSAKLSPKSNLLVTANFINSNVDKTTKGLGGYYMTTLTWPGDNDMRSYLNANNTRKLLFSSGTTNSTEYDNPYWDVNKNEAKDRTNRIMGNVTYNLNPSKVIGFTSIVSVDNYTTQGYQVTNPTSRYGVATNGYFSQFDLIFRQLTGNFRTTLKKTFGEFRNTLSMGFYVEDNRRVVNSFKGERFFEPGIASINNTEPITRVPVNSIQETRKIRFYGQYQLNWKDILIPTFSFAHEGTSVLMSRFVNKDPFYSYGSGSLAFNISEIPSFKDKFRKVDLLKFRTSYSTSGQTAGLLPYNIDPTFQAVTTTGGGYAYGFTGNNFKLQPQFTRSFEYGLEGSFFKKRLGINLSVYKNKTTDQIFFPRVSYGAGFVLKYFNGGDVQNKGIEIQLTGTPVKTKNVTWDLTFNFDHFENTVLKINAGPGGYYESDTWVYGNLRTQTSPGKSIYSLYGTAFAKNDKGQLLISPTTGLPVTTSNFGQPFVFVGDRAPDFSIGILNSISYKTFTLSFNLDIRKGGDIFNGTEMALYRNGLSTRTLDRETPRIIQGVLNDGLQNTANPTPNNIVITPYFRNDFYQSTAAGGAGFVEADFVEKNIKWLRMRDLTLSYKLHADVVKRFRIKSASFFITATDLFLITNYAGADPSVNSNTASAGGIGGMGIDYGSISTPRAINTGIRISF